MPWYMRIKCTCWLGAVTKTWQKGRKGGRNVSNHREEKNHVDIFPHRQVCVCVSQDAALFLTNVLVQRG